MARTIQLSETELTRLIQRVVNEQPDVYWDCVDGNCEPGGTQFPTEQDCQDSNCEERARPGGYGGRDKSMSAMEVKETETSNCSCCRKNIREIPGGLHIPSCCQGCEDEGGQLPILLPGGMVSNEPGTKEDIRENHLSRRVINEQLLCDPTSMCQKDCSVLVPQSWFTMADTKPCNWVNNRFNAFNARHISMLEDGMCTTCQYKRVMCKYTYLRDLKIQNGC